MKHPLILACLGLTSCALDDVNYSASIGYGPITIAVQPPARGKSPVGKSPVQEVLPPQRESNDAKPGMTTRAWEAYKKLIGE